MAAFALPVPLWFAVALGLAGVLGLVALLRRRAGWALYVPSLRETRDSWG